MGPNFSSVVKIEHPQKFLTEIANHLFARCNIGQFSTLSVD